MLKQIQWAKNKRVQKEKHKAPIDFLNHQEVARAKQFHASFPAYHQTPLRSLEALAAKLGVAGVYVKDESYRFGLNAFKVLGGAYAMGRFLAQQLRQDPDSVSYARLISPEWKAQLGNITFTTATDGNHGRGVAWTARQLGQKAVVYMPKGSSLKRFDSIRGEGAEVVITDLNYDEAVRLAAANARKYGWVVVQDTAWAGYEEIPAWIMQGYGTMALEALDQLKLQGISKPTHILLQAGVGSLAGAVQGYFAAMFPEDCPRTIIVESDQADCLFKSVQAGDGQPHAVGGDMATIMAGLACGEPNVTGWNILRDCSELFVSCPDWVAAKGMRMLGNPLEADARVISGESGAVTTGLLGVLMQAEECRQLREDLGLDASSRVLLFSTEGDTDPDRYRSIVWDGEYPSFMKGRQQ